MELETGKFSVYGSQEGRQIQIRSSAAATRSAGSRVDRMLFDLQLLGKPDANGNAAVVESRTHAGASIEEAVRTAKIIVQSTLVPGTYGFRLIRNGLEVLLW